MKSEFRFYYGADLVNRCFYAMSHVMRAGRKRIGDTSGWSRTSHCHIPGMSVVSAVALSRRAEIPRSRVPGLERGRGRVAQVGLDHVGELLLQDRPVAFTGCLG